jgi:hypothetical protein
VGLQNPVHRFDSGRCLSEKARNRGFLRGSLLSELAQDRVARRVLNLETDLRQRLQALADRDHAAFPVFKL